MIIRVVYGQTLMDIAIQYYGDPRALVDLANNNGIAIDDEIFAGQPLQILNSANGIPVFSEYLIENKIAVVSGQGGDQEQVYLLATNDNEIITDNDNAIEI